MRLRVAHHHNRLHSSHQIGDGSNHTQRMALVVLLSSFLHLRTLISRSTFRAGSSLQRLEVTLFASTCTHQVATIRTTSYAI